MLPTDHYLRFERVSSVEVTDRGVVAHVHGEQLHVEVVAADVVRLTMSRAGVVDETPTAAVCVDPFAVPVARDVRHDEERVRVVTAALVVSVWLDPFRVDVHRSDGTVVLETAADADGRYWPYATLNDAFTVRRRCRPDDAFFGLGEKGGAHDRRGRDFTLWNTDVLNGDATAEFRAGKEPGDPRGDNTSTDFDPLYVNVPLLHHQDGRTGAIAGSFVDNGYRGSYELSAPEEYRISFSGGCYREYVFAGPGMAAVLERYTALTGRMQPPPLWALGYHQCRWAAYSQDDVEAVGARHRDLDVPCDALWLDIEHMDGYRVFTWDPARFPDPRAMIERLSLAGFRVVTIVDPGVKNEPGYAVFDDGRAREVFCRDEGGDLYVGQVWPGDTVFPDLATEEAREWWGRLTAAHVASGPAGVWNDMNEPATGSVPPDRMRFGRGEHPHERFHNQYALLMAMATRDGLLAAAPQQRTFVLSRAGSAGIQRYAANWMGDNLSRWDHLAVGIPMGSGLGVSGQPFVGADIGGFQGDSDAELFVRWMQYGTLTPFCRNHCEIGNVDQYAWSFGEQVLELAREAVRLRYRLLPYVYSAFARSTRTGEPVQRPLVLDHQDDPVARGVDDQFLFGRDLLVAPVTAPGSTERPVHLPTGGWYDWHTDELLEGGRSVVAPTPLDRIPLYARAGAVVPMWAHAPASTAEPVPDTVELHLYVPAADGTTHGELVEDDGLTLAVLDGAYRRTAFAVSRSGAEIELVATVTGDGFPEMGRTHVALVVHGASPASVRVDGVTVEPVKGRFRFADAGSGFVVRLAT